MSIWPNWSYQPSPYAVYGTFAGVHLIAGGQPHRALVGRTFHQHIKMH